MRCHDNWEMALIIYIFYSKFDTSAPGSASMYTSVNLLLLTHLVVDMQLLPGVNVPSIPGEDIASLPGVDVKYLACVCESQRTCVCARQPT